MNQDGVRKPIHLQQEDLISSLPETVTERLRMNCLVS